MMLNRRYVIDTNLLVSAVLSPNHASIPTQCLNYVLDEGVFLMSDATLEELRDVLHRPKFERYLSPLKRDTFLSNIETAAEMIHVSSAISACRDPRDDKFLSLAVGGEADAIITGDTDLLVLHPFMGIDIVTAKNFIDKLYLR